jgi:glyoxylase-like metal-dependent hydrolase (beta-lactamase superfamily II)
MMIWRLRGNGSNILVDSGFDHERFFKDWHVIDFTKPSDTLKQVGLKPEDITDIIITHMHWDHADGIDLFPNARIWMRYSKSSRTWPQESPKSADFEPRRNGGK